MSVIPRTTPFRQRPLMATRRNLCKPLEASASKILGGVNVFSVAGYPHPQVLELGVQDVAPVCCCLRFGHLLTGQRTCHPYEGCNVEPAGTGKDSSTQRCSGIPASHRAGRRGHGSERTPHQASPRGLPQERCRRTGPWEPGPKTSQRRP